MGGRAALTIGVIGDHSILASAEQVRGERSRSRLEAFPNVSLSNYTCVSTEHG